MTARNICSGSGDVLCSAAGVPSSSPTLQARIYSGRTTGRSDQSPASVQEFSTTLLSHALVSPRAHINSTAQADSPKKHRLLNVHLSCSLSPAHTQASCRDLLIWALSGSLAAIATAEEEERRRGNTPITTSHAGRRPQKKS
ncbi:unnamed protein product [Leuciscus chuanchicus]